MKLSLRNLSEWLRRGGDTLPGRPARYAYTPDGTTTLIQPVEIVGEMSRLTVTGEQWGPARYANARVEPIPGPFDVGWELRSLAPGGTIVTSLQLTSTTAGLDIGFDVLPIGTLTGTSILFGKILGGPGSNVLAFASERTNADAIGNQSYMLRTLSNQAQLVPFVPGFWVPPGSALYLENPLVTTSAAMSVGISFFELVV